jgi:hypothetical protein
MAKDGNVFWQQGAEIKGKNLSRFILISVPRSNGLRYNTDSEKMATSAMDALTGSCRLYTMPIQIKWTDEPDTVQNLELYSLGLIRKIERNC